MKTRNSFPSVSRLSPALLGAGAIALMLAAACGGDDPPADPVATGAGAGASGGGGSSAGGSGGESFCEAGETEACYDGQDGTQGVGVCVGGIATCLPDGSAFGDCEDQVLPGIEDCTAEGDENCDGVSCSETVWAYGAVATSGMYSVESVVDADGNTIMVGIANRVLTLETVMYDAPIGSSHVFVVKLTPEGSTLWSRAFLVGTTSLSLDVAIGDTGDVYLAGAFRDSINFGVDASTAITAASVDEDDVYIVHLSGQTGAHVASTHMGSLSMSGVKRVAGVGVDVSGNVYVAGYYEGNFGGICLPPPIGCPAVADGSGAFVALYSNAMEPSWRRQYDGPGLQHITAIGVGPGATGVVVAGRFYKELDMGEVVVTTGDTDSFVANLTQAGAAVWANTFNQGALSPAGVSMTLDEVAVIGTYQGPAEFAGTTLMVQGDRDLFVATMGVSDGLPGSFVGFGMSGGNFLSSYSTRVAHDPSGNLFLVGGFSNLNALGPLLLENRVAKEVANRTNGFYAKLSSVGVPIWARTLQTGRTVRLRGVSSGVDGNMIVSGTHRAELMSGSEHVLPVLPVGDGAFVMKVQP